jgi:hypothetical protein
MKYLFVSLEDGDSYAGNFIEEEELFRVAASKLKVFQLNPHTAQFESLQLGAIDYKNNRPIYEQVWKQI